MANAITSVSAKVTDSKTLNLTSDSSRMIRYVSSVEASMITSVPIGDEYKATIKNGSVTYSGTSNTFTNVIDNTFYFEVKQTGGIYEATYKTLDLVEYSYPTCKMTIDKITGSGVMNLTITGNYFSGDFEYGDTHHNSANHVSVQYRYKPAGQDWGSWITVPTSNSTTDYKWTDTKVYVDYRKYTAEIIVRGLDYNTVYSVQARVVDRVGAVSTREDYGVSDPIFDWSAHDFNFNVPVEAQSTITSNGIIYANGGIEITGDLSVTGNVSAGSFGNQGTVGATAINGDNYYFSTGILSNGGSHTFTFYLLKPFNLVFLRGYVSGLSKTVSSSTSFVDLCKFQPDLGAASNTALAISTSSNCSGIINLDGTIKIRPLGGLTTGSQLFISGVYPLSTSSSFYQS